MAQKKKAAASVAEKGGSPLEKTFRFCWLWGTKGNEDDPSGKKRFWRFFVTGKALPDPLRGNDEARCALEGEEKRQRG